MSLDQKQQLSHCCNSVPWQQATFDLDQAFGFPPSYLHVEFSACDAGSDSGVEAMVDEVKVTTTACAK